MNIKKDVKHYYENCLRNEFIQNRLGMVFIIDKLRENQLRWHGYVLRRLVDAFIRKVETL